jgi:hypothetical protein
MVVMKLVKIFLLEYFFQLLIRAHDLLFLGHFETKSSFPSLGFVSDQPSFPFFQNIDFVLVFQKMNVLIFHKYRLSCVYDLLLSQELGDWVKARSITWYCQFLMTKKDGLNIFELVEPL